MQANTELYSVHTNLFFFPREPFLRLEWLLRHEGHEDPAYWNFVSHYFCQSTERYSFNNNCQGLSTQDGFRIQLFTLAYVIIR